MDTYEPDFEQIARQAMGGTRVAVFCDNVTQADHHRKAVAAAARRLGATKVTCPRTRRTVEIGPSTVWFFLDNGIDGRGASADVVYLSDAARMQLDFATLMGGTVA